MKYEKRIAIIEGPNLNLTGVREAQIYGKRSMGDYIRELREAYSWVEISHYQSNVEGEIINQIQAVGFTYDGIIINAGGYSHTSVAIHDALKAVPAPAIEVHLSNIFAREEYRHHSLLSEACMGIICGLGLEGYKLALQALINKKEEDC